ncbi:MAG: S-layer protein domain-containing protein [Candidatus Methanoperedens sp.]|nr:S-layer protein domain-containing protein [Candidatus Methanoperedens sp.]
MLNKNRLSGTTLLIFMLSTALILSGCIKSEETLQKPLVPNINESPIGQISEDEIRVDSNVTDSNIGIEPITDSGFYELAGILTKKWDASNFPGFWRDQETGVSTEELVIDQSINNSRRIIEKHNLIYRTRPESVNFQVYRNTNKAPSGTNGSYQVMGWLGEKHVFFQGNKIAKIIFEQNATEKKIMTTGDSWYFDEGYRFFAHTVEAPLERMAWVEFLKDNKSLQELVIPDREAYAYQVDATGTPVFVTYPYIHRGNETDIGEFMYTWLRSANLKSINFSDTFGIMEVTSVDNGMIELRNRAPIELAPDSTINLMGNLNLKVGSSNTSLSFYPYRVKNPNVK